MEEDVASERSHPALPNVAGFISDCAKAQIHVQINTYRKGLLRSAELGELEGSEVGGELEYVRVPLHEQFRTRKILQVEQNGARRSITLKALWSNREYARPDAQGPSPRDSRPAQCCMQATTLHLLILHLSHCFSTRLRRLCSPSRLSSPCSPARRRSSPSLGSPRAALRERATASIASLCKQPFALTAPVTIRSRHRHRPR